MHILFNEDNREVMEHFVDRIDLVYADMIYEDRDLSWIDLAVDCLIDSGVLIVQTDFHTVSLVWEYLNNLKGMNFINHLVWKNEWGNHPKDRFHQCFDDILIFSKGKHKKFYSERIQVEKATANTKLNPSNRPTKTATAFISDICLTTTSKERVTDPSTGKLIRWQKPTFLMQRIVDPFTDEGDNILDIYMGSGSLGVWCLQNKRNYVGIELDKNVFKRAEERLKGVTNGL